MKDFMTTLTLLAIFVFGTFANAANIDIQRRDMKLASQVMIEKQTITTPILASTTRIKSGQATSASVVTNITTFAAQPDVPRNVTVTTGGTTADCAAGNVVVTGTNFFGASISESLAITADQAGSTTGSKAFKTVTNVLIPVQDGASCTYSVGVGSKLGMKRCMASADHFFHAGLNGTKETTAPTIAASASAVESNTAQLSTALDGTKDVVLFFAQNFACLP